MLQSKKLDTPYPDLWIAYHKTDITKFIQNQIDQFAYKTLHEYTEEEATQMLKQLKIMESYKPKSTIYHQNYNPDEEEKKNDIWPLDATNVTEHQDLTPWIDDKEADLPQIDPRP